MSKKIFTGALLGTLLGSLAVAIYPRRHEILDVIVDRGEDLSERARDYANMLLDKGREFTGLRVKEETHHNYWKGGLAGILLGVGITALVAPKSRKHLHHQVLKMYHEIFGKTHEVIKDFKKNSHPFNFRKKTSPLKRAKRLLKAKS